MDEETVRKFDWRMIGAMLGICLVGFANLYSATFNETVSHGFTYYKVELIWFGIGCALSSVLLLIHYKILSRFAYPIYFSNLFLLVLVLIIGRSSMGGRRWISIGPFGFQPSEFMKISAALAMAKYFEAETNVPAAGYRLRDLWLPLAMLLVPAGLIAMEPDLGTTMVLVLMFVSIMLFIKVDRRTLIMLCVVFLVAAPFVYRYGLKDYQRQRLVTFINPMSDPKGAGYNSIQSMIAIGSGQLMGKGFRKGTQSQLNFLPEHHTDFIFSVFSEEHGFAGALVLLVLYGYLLITGLNIAYVSHDKFGTLLALELLMIYFWHIFVNIGMVCGILPIVGVPLPFLSYGGSSLITSIMGIAILTNISNKRFMF